MSQAIPAPIPRVTAVVFSAARPLDALKGLLGFIAATVGGLRIDGIALRRTRAGRLDLRYPERRSGPGARSHAVVRPMDEGVRQAIESQIFAALRAAGALS